MSLHLQGNNVSVTTPRYQTVRFYYTPPFPALLRTMAWAGEVLSRMEAGREGDGSCDSEDGVQESAAARTQSSTATELLQENLCRPAAVVRER